VVTHAERLSKQTVLSIVVEHLPYIRFSRLRPVFCPNYSACINV